jgi:hypothetical protein
MYEFKILYDTHNNICQPQIYKNMETHMRFTYEVFSFFLFEEICSWEFEERPI